MYAACPCSCHKYMCASSRRVVSGCIPGLCLIVPGFIIVAIMTARDGCLGLLLTPASFGRGFTLLISVALGAIVAPLCHQAGDVAQMWLYLCLSTVFLVLTVVYLKDLKIGGETA